MRHQTPIFPSGESPQPIKYFLQRSDLFVKPVFTKLIRAISSLAAFELSKLQTTIQLGRWVLDMKLEPQL